MPQILLKTYDNNTLTIDDTNNIHTYHDLIDYISLQTNIPKTLFDIEDYGNTQSLSYNDACNCSNNGITSSLCSVTTINKTINNFHNHTTNDIYFFEMKMKINGGIDFQHREGSKIGSGGQASESQAALERKERLRKLALETIDITKDPYIIRNNLGTFECKLCLTVHPNEGNYLAHTQGKRHQYNLGRRAAMEAKNAAPRAMIVQKEVPKRNVLKIGRPGYKVTKSRDIHTKQRSLTFEIDYPEIEAGNQPRHRFMSAYEQKVEIADKNYQYLLFACDPYETIAFKIPNHAIDKREGRFFTNWDQHENKFVLQLFFLDEDMNK